MSDLAHLSTASDMLLDSRALLKRVDTKFICRTDEIPNLLGRLHADQYGVARHANGELFAYTNQYFDTPERDFLREHHRGRRPRFKVRLRHHQSRELSYFELKEKRPNGTTNKVRVPIAYQSKALGPIESDILPKHGCRLETLEESMQIGFDRIMLVGLRTEERITIDSGVWFSDASRRERIDNLAIVEVKQARFKARSPIMQALRHQHAFQLRVSKYITGAQLLWPDIRLNRYNNRLRMLRRRIAQ